MPDNLSNAFEVIERRMHAKLEAMRKRRIDSMKDLHEVALALHEDLMDDEAAFGVDSNTRSFSSLISEGDNRVRISYHTNHVEFACVVKGCFIQEKFHYESPDLLDNLRLLIDKWVGRWKN